MKTVAIVCDRFRISNLNTLVAMSGGTFVPMAGVKMMPPVGGAPEAEALAMPASDRFRRSERVDPQ